MRAVAMTLAVIGWIALAGPVRAQETVSPLPKADRTAIRAVIQDQLGAFRRDDGPAAFADAAPSIQHMFGDPATFLDMVRRGYPPVYRPGSFAFGALVDHEGRTIQTVELTGPDGTRNLALYTMEREADGNWRIAGCMLVPGETVGA